MKNAECNYGGQAVIEGVMMRSPLKYAIAVRRPDKEIILKIGKLRTLSDKMKFLKWPIFRGVINLVESLVLGLKALTYSAEQATGEEEKINSVEMFFTIVIAFGLFIVFFIALPTAMARYLDRYLSNVIIYNLFEGLLRISIFITYLFFISRIKDIKRVFEYHGAEHKVIYTYEAGEELNVDNVKKYSTLHPRCGTSFIFIVLIMSILVFSLLGKQTLLLRIAYRIAIIPIIAGLSYEILKLSAKNMNKTIVKWAVMPGLWFQKLTTSEPDDAQIEIQNEEVEEFVEIVAQEEVQEEEAEEIPFVVVEEMPMFPGGDIELLRYIADHTEYPEIAKENNIQGRVIIRFCVTAKGGVSQVSILKGVDPELDKEAIRVVRDLPAFKPGKQGGKPVPVWYMVPITYTLK